MSKKKILIIKLGAIGDVVHTTVIASAIKASHSDWEVHYMTIGAIEPVISTHPHIDKIIKWDVSQRKSYSYLWRIASILREEKYDVIFNMTNALRNNLLSYLAFPKKVVAKKSFGKSWVEEYFLCAKSVFPELVLPVSLSLGVKMSATEKMDVFLKKYPRPYIVISPGGIANNHRQGRVWSIKKWQDLISDLNNFEGTVFTIGASAEEEIHKKLEGVVLLTGQYTLDETCALISRANLLISGDTGPAHIASAYGVNTLVLLGSTSPDKIKPYGKTGYYVEPPFDCKYCWQKKCKMVSKGADTTPCMESITPQLILDKIREYKLL